MDRNSDTVELFRTLYAAYGMTRGFQKHPIIFQQLAGILGYDMDDNSRYQNFVELIVHLKNEWLLREEPQLVITNSGIHEIESSLLEPDKPTPHFPPNIRRFVMVDESLIQFVREMRKARKDYLMESYRIAGGLETAIVNPFDVKENLALEQSLFERIYYYLEEEGLIKFIHSAGISLTHKGKLEIQGETLIETGNSSFWHSVYPDVTISDDIVQVIDRINSSSVKKLGCEIFRNRAGPITELRIAIKNLNKDSKDKPAFVTCLLSIATILSEINTNELTKYLSKADIEGSVNIIQELLFVKRIKYDESDLRMFRKLIRLRSTVSPVHSGEAEFSQILLSFDIQYPVIDWAQAADTCLKHMLNALKGLEKSLI